MTRKSTMTESLKSAPAQQIDTQVNSALQAYEDAVARSAAIAQESASADEESRERRDVEAAAAAQEKAFETLIRTLGEKKAYIESVLLDSKKRVEELTARADGNPDAELATALTDDALITAALGDVEAKIKDLEKKQQGKRKRNPAPSKRSRKGSIEAKGLTKEIVAVLAEADKVKTTKTNKTDTTARYRLKAKYRDYAVPELNKKFKYKNPNEVPKLEKILLNVGLGDVKDDGKKFNNAVEELRIISGQKPILTTAKKSIANFKVRQGMNIGAKVTLRGDRMYEFLDKLISIALPRVRDFKGVNPNSFDGRGNYAMGVKEQLIFPEIKYDKIDKVRGFDIAIVTTAKTDEEAKELLSLLGMPFRA